MQDSGYKKACNNSGTILMNYAGFLNLYERNYSLFSLTLLSYIIYNPYIVNSQLRRNICGCGILKQDP